LLRAIHWTCGLGIGILLTSATLFAQAPSLQGHVTDPSGSAIPGAAVIVSRGSSSKTAKGEPQGEYQFGTLDPGVWNVRALAPGFAPYEQSGVEIGVTGARVLDISLAIAAQKQQVTVAAADATKLDVDASSNASALVLRGADLQALSDDPDDLAADLAALAGPAVGPNGGQIYVDGFTGGRLPPKQSIREIRINQNPFAAQFDRPGQGRVEILTKPGSEEFHGQLLFQFSDAALNSRNPFVAVKPPYQRRQWEGETSGPLGKKTSFFFDLERRDITENAFINAITLDSHLNLAPFSQAALTPLAGTELNFQVDRQLKSQRTIRSNSPSP
jgi:Carboxypeptidase regulatory-like domain